MIKHKILEKLLRLAILCVGILLLINVIITAAVSSGFHFGFQLQTLASIVFILYAIFFHKLPKFVHIALVLAFAASVCFSLFLGAYGNRNNVDYTEDVVIVLGAGVRGELVSRHLAFRLNRAIDYLANNPDALVVVTGGLGQAATITEAEASKRYLVARGVAPERILLEEKSTSTYENLYFANEILSEHFPYGFRAVVISNDFHIYRAVRTARGVGIYAYGAGARTPRTAIPINYLREMSAVAHMWVSQTLAFAIN